jgi:uncharacterized membrane protein YoaK (UPF0700 family)
MLSARAYSFRQQSRLAISLSWIAGFTNVVILTVTTHVVSHATGALTYFGDALAQRKWSPMVFFAFLLTAFLGGAIASAFMTEGVRRRGSRSSYVLPMAVEALLLLALMLGVQRHPHAAPSDTLAVYFLTGVSSFAMGLQNATITRISGAVVRTTHVTGVVTDFGLESVQFLLWYWDRLRSKRKGRLGRVLRVTQRHPTFLRLLLLASIFGSFMFGVIIGSFCFARLSNLALLLPIGFLIWIIIEDWRHPIAEVRELDLLSDPELRMYGLVKSLLPADMGIYRVSPNHSAHGAHGAHRAPNFQFWIDRTPRHWRVIVLALSPLLRLETNAILDLEQAVRKLHSQGRCLILGGLTPAHFQALEALGVVDLISSENLCPDLEFAIARGISLVQRTGASIPASVSG